MTPLEQELFDVLKGFLDEWSEHEFKPGFAVDFIRPVVSKPEIERARDVLARAEAIRHRAQANQ